MYDEKVNYGDDEHPIWRDRLWINTNGHGYGFNLFDRQEKKTMIMGQTKEFCEEGRKLLKAGDLAGFSIHMKNQKEFVVTNQILIYKEKYGNSYYNVFTITQLYKVALEIVQNRMDDGYIQEFNLPEKLDFTKEDIEKLPESLRKEAEKKLEYYQANLKSIKENNQSFLDAKKAVETQDGYLAWLVLNNRAGYEYENFEIVSVTDL